MAIATYPVLTWTLLVCLLCSSCSSLVADATPVNDFDVFPSAAQPFENYMDAAADYIERHQMPQRGQLEVSINTPFELSANPDRRYRGRFLLIHGLNDSPFMWRDMGREIAEMGFDVRAVLLPGHGTTPRALLDVHYTEWLEHVRAHIEFWQGDINQQGSPLYLGGFSLGAVIATIMALENVAIEGLLLVSPAWRSRLHHWVRWAGLYKHWQPWIFGGMILEDIPLRYNSIPVNSLSQYFKTTRSLNRRWRRRTLDFPVLVIATADDSVLSVDDMFKRYRSRFVSPERSMILYANDWEKPLQPAETVRESRSPDHRILNQSHMSLLISPDNELLGRSRALLLCNGNTPSVFFGCKRASNHWYGAQHTPSPDGNAVARTTFNPDFDFLVDQIDEHFSNSANSDAD